MLLIPAATAVGFLLALALILGLVDSCRGEGDDDAHTTGWQITIYYTPVERYHDGAPLQVVGCTRAGCDPADEVLGTYPSDFVAAVELEGNGRITSGEHAGLVLNWTEEDGFWLDSSPRDRDGEPLRPFATASADREVLAAGTRFRVEDCGRTAEGTDVADEVCRRISDARWTVGEPFTSNPKGAKHLDVYVGDESSPAFTESGWYTTLVDVELSL